MAAGLIVALAAGGALVTLRDRRSVSSAALPEPEAKRFYADVKISLSPLLGHVVALPAALEQARLQPVAPGVAGTAQAWADDAATARDLVGRLIPPASSLGLPIRTVYELGAAMFVESARALERLAGEPEEARRAQAAVSGLRVRLLSDRLFDGAKRLLDLPAASDGSAILPAEVPDFEKEGLAPGAPSAAAAGGTGPADPSPATIPAARWKLDHRPAVAGTVRILEETVPFDALLQSRHQLPDWADQLRAISWQLGGPVPASRVAREASFLLRLSLLTQSEALAVASMTKAQHDTAFIQAERLRLIADQLWNVAGELFETDGVRLGHALPETGIDPTILRRGGLFDGRPPPLARGDRPDSGVPGGLHLPDPSKVFSGR